MSTLRILAQKGSEVPHIEDIEEIVWKRIEKASQ